MNKLLSITYQPYKLLVLSPVIILSTLILGITSVFFAIFISPKIASKYIGSLWAKVIAISTPMFVEIEGKENIKKNTSYIITPNHQSQYDIMVLYGWLGIDIKWVMKKELRKVPMLGYACEKMGHVFINRTNKKNALETLEETKGKLANGASIIIFPEGTRSKINEIGIFKRGAFSLAIDLKTEILPITIIGTNKILPPDTFNILPGKVKMIIHKPISTTNYTDQDVMILCDKVKDIVNSPFVK